MEGRAAGVAWARTSSLLGFSTDLLERFLENLDWHRRTSPHSELAPSDVIVADLRQRGYLRTSWSVNRIRVALVGARLRGRHHARVVAESAAADLIGDPGRPARVRRNWLLRLRHAPLLDSLDELLAGELPDLAIVAIPTKDHAKTTSRLLAAGVHVLVDKPISGMVDEGLSA